MTLHFACDPATEDATATLLEWMQACPAPCFALLDMALLDPPQRQTLGARHRGKLVNAFANTSLAAFGEHAPHLLPLSPDPQQRSIEVTQLLGLIGITPALSWVRSDSPVAALHSLFGYLGKASGSVPRAIVKMPLPAPYRAIATNASHGSPEINKPSPNRHSSTPTLADHVG